MSINFSLYGDFIAGSLPLSKENPSDVIALVAGTSLHTNRIHQIHTIDNNQIFYLAIPSMSLASSPDFKTPLAAALPGHAEHKGDGAYIVYIEENAAAVIRSGISLRYLFNTAEAVEAACESADIPVYNVTDSDQSWPMISAASMAYLASRSLNALVLKWAISWGFVCFIFYTVLTAYSAVVEGGNPVVRDQQKIEDVLNSAAMQQPVAQAASRIHAISSVAIKAGGWIDYYTLESGKEEYLVWLPSWTSREHIEAFSGASTEYNKTKNLIMVHKGPIKNKKTEDLPSRVLTEASLRPAPMPPFEIKSGKLPEAPAGLPPVFNPPQRGQ